jgi:hypothetical protein
MKVKPYCRALEDNSGFIIAEPIVRKTSFNTQVNHDAPSEFICQKWERVLGVGDSPSEAFVDYIRAKVGMDSRLRNAPSN